MADPRSYCLLNGAVQRNRINFAQSRKKRRLIARTRYFNGLRAYSHRILTQLPILAAILQLA